MDLQTLIDAGLPATEAHYDTRGNLQTSFSRELTAEEWRLYLTLTNPAAARNNIAKSEAAKATALNLV